MFSERLKRLTPYVPGEQPQDREYLKLNTNENPYPPCPGIADLLRTFDTERLRLYSDPVCGRLRERIARKHSLLKEQVFVSNGSDEALSFCFYAFFDSLYGRLLFPEYTYSFYPVYCDFYGITYERIPLDREFRVDLDGFLKKGDGSCGAIFANPNAPTGTYLALDRIVWFLENYHREKIVVIDEAYIDFGGESAAALLGQFQNLVIVRTFSKGMSLAGLRLGYTLTDKELIKALFTVKDSFNSYPADTLSQLIGEIAIEDDLYYAKIREKIIATREYFSSELERLGWFVLPSRANFVFVSKEGIPGKDIYLKLKEKGILVRHFDVEGIKDFVRITIGTRDQMARLLSVATCLFP
ncbi:MAG: histidinol-phosphate transaminase [Deltaproteobacteria bacterium]|nr:histidinol-phosphate transaminase [Deltaproteobacteria bacterium]MBW2136080.1 histidinol-phosphate transaminase [Deltaproteobacteria bacterium]